jgi:hypothetical protein
MAEDSENRAMVASDTVLPQLPAFPGPSAVLPPLPALPGSSNISNIPIRPSITRPTGPFSLGIFSRSAPSPMASSSHLSSQPASRSPSLQSPPPPLEQTPSLLMRALQQQRLRAEASLVSPSPGLSARPPLSLHNATKHPIRPLPSVAAAENHRQPSEESNVDDLLDGLDN